MSVVDWFECEDGYPTDDSIERLKKTEFDMSSAATFWLHDFPAICQNIGTCAVSVYDGERYGRPMHVIEFHTGGWSGAEDLIDAALGHFWLAHHHTKWERGGHFWFEVDKRSAQPEGATP